MNVFQVVLTRPLDDDFIGLHRTRSIADSTILSTPILIANVPSLQYAIDWFYADDTPMGEPSSRPSGPGCLLSDEVALCQNVAHDFVLGFHYFNI